MKLTVILLVCIASVLTMTSCSPKKDQGARDKLETAKSLYFFDEYYKDRSDETIALLSIKYGCDLKVTTQIVEELREFDPKLGAALPLWEAKTMQEFEEMKGKLKSISGEDRIERLSEEVDMKPSRIAALLIDYRLWQAKRN